MVAQLVARRRQPVVVHEDPRRRRLGVLPVVPGRPRAARARPARAARTADHLLRRGPGRGTAGEPGVARVAGRRGPRDREPLVPPRAVAPPLLGRRARRGAGPGRGRDRSARPGCTRRASAAPATASRRRRCGSWSGGATRTTRRRCPPTSDRSPGPSTSAPRSSPPSSAPSASSSTGRGPTVAGPSGPYRWLVGDRTLLELPVTTLARAQGADPRELPAHAERGTHRRSRVDTSTRRCAGAARPESGRRSSCIRSTSCPVTT